MITRFKQKLYQELIEKSFSEAVFPAKKMPLWKTRIRLNNISDQLKKRGMLNLVGELYNLPSQNAVEIWKQFLPQNPNHLGNWSKTRRKKLFATFQLEKEVILQMTSLLKASSNDIEGYMVSGATEGNIFSAWMGRKYLEKFVEKDKICLVKNDLTHYSVKKAADIIGINDFNTPIDNNKWNTDLISLEKTIESLYKQGYRGFLIPLTFGYTVGGSNDDYKATCLLLEKFKRERKDLHFFVWIDAALSGLIMPFMSNNFEPFNNKQIQTFILDFHKFAGIPYPAGLILYRKNLRKLIEKNIPYLKEKDSTLLGSRTGISAVCVWATIQLFGKEGFKRLINNCLKRKEEFLTKVKREYSYVKIISEKNSVQAAIIVKKPLPKDFCQKYGLSLIRYQLSFKDNKQAIKLYKLFFLPKFINK
ncbi:MAG: pyridoxal-dependent decarboxylase [bacterium]|nr:pyridoxal-dependent decarboxylase [bacterium]